MPLAEGSTEVEGREVTRAQIEETDRLARRAMAALDRLAPEQIAELERCKAEDWAPLVLRMIPGPYSASVPSSLSDHFEAIDEAAGFARGNR